MRLLVTDGSSGLGQMLSRAFEAESFSLHSVQSELDWSSSEAFLALLDSVQPDFVISTAGWAAVPSEAQQKTLVRSASVVSKVCAVKGIVPIHLSSYRVFGGDHKASYSELDSPVPVTAAGGAFRDAEQCFIDNSERWLCLRLGWVLGSWSGNTLSNLLSALVGTEELGGQSLTMNTGYPGAPTTDHDIARVLVSVIRQISCGAENWGLFNYCSGDTSSQGEFASAVASILEQDNVLRGSLKVEDREPAQGEAGSAVLSCRRIADNFGVQPRSWRQGLHTMIKLWLRESGHG